MQYHFEYFQKKESIKACSNIAKSLFYPYHPYHRPDRINRFITPFPWRGNYNHLPRLDTRPLTCHDHFLVRSTTRAESLPSYLKLIRQTIVTETDAAYRPIPRGCYVDSGIHHSVAGFAEGIVRGREVRGPVVMWPAHGYRKWYRCSLIECNLFC